MIINVSPENLSFFQCFSSKTRLKIIELLNEEPKNIGELANLLNVSSTIITRHISMLENAGIIKTETLPGKRGIQKKCELNVNQITLNIDNKIKTQPSVKPLSIPIGYFNDYQVTPTCGLASVDKLIGIMDDPRYFSNPEKINTSLLWFSSGYVEYSIPSYIFKSNKIESLQISLEICSEYPGYNEDYPSDISFYINDILIGEWTSPGDYGKIKGIYTPDWWTYGTQYGLLKTIKITNNETLIDGTHVSNVTLNDLNINFRKDTKFKISSLKDAINAGGVTLFGKGFGNYPCGIDVLVKESI